jgi:hypothetical protein
MPIGGPYSRSGSGHFPYQQKTHAGQENGLKTRLCDRFISSDWQNKADLRVFRNGARYGLLFWYKIGNWGSD